MTRILDGIRKNDFVVVGRVGMDLFPDPPGMDIENATTLNVDMGGSSANIAAGVVKLGGKASLPFFQLPAVEDAALRGLALFTRGRHTRGG